MHYLRLFITEKSGNYWHFAHIIPHAKTCGDNLQKNSKSNETRIFAEGRQGRWIFFFKLQLELALSMLKICLLEKCRFHLLSELYHCSEKLCHFPFDASRHPLPTQCALGYQPSLQTPPPPPPLSLFCTKPLTRSENCPNLPFLGNAPSTFVFREPPHPPP